MTLSAQIAMSFVLLTTVTSTTHHYLVRSTQKLTAMDLLKLDTLPVDLREAIILRPLAAGQALIRQGDPASACFVTASGRFRVVRPTPERRFVTLQVARKGDMFGESALFTEFYSYTVFAETASEVLVYPKALLLSSLKAHASLAEVFMSQLIQKQESLMIHLELRDIRVAHTRVLHYLRSQLGQDKESPVDFDRPLKDIARDLGLAPATLSRALSRLEQTGAISRESSGIKLHDVSAA